MKLLEFLIEFLFLLFVVQFNNIKDKVIELFIFEKYCSYYCY